MPTYSTPDPIVAVIEFEGGDARILASERDDTVVEVRPSDDPATTTSGRPSRRASSTRRAGFWSRGRSSATRSASPAWST